MAGLIEMAFVFCAALGLGLFELARLKRLKDARERADKDGSHGS